MDMAIELEALTKVFRPRGLPAVTALRDVTLTAPAGQVLGIVGAPGAGKTTLLRVIAGQTRPTGGRARVLGRDITDEAQTARRHVRLLADDEARLPAGRSVWRVIADAGRRHGLDGAAIDARTECLLRYLHLWEERALPAAALARAARRAVALAIAAIDSPPILLLDEPLHGLPAPTARAVLDRLKIVAREGQRTVVVTGDDPAALASACDRLLLLRDGQIAADLDADACASSPEPIYQFRLGGRLDASWSDWFDGLTIASDNADGALLTGPVPDQAALFGLLARVRDLGLPLLEVCRIGDRPAATTGGSDSTPSQRAHPYRAAR